MLYDLSDRERAILELLADRSYLSVSEFSSILGVSEVTIRETSPLLKRKDISCAHVEELSLPYTAI
jgi:Transcriptional regulators of sugar metabolism